MDPLSDDELSEILQKLESSQAPPTLETRILRTRGTPPADRVWNRMVSYSVRVPLVALALMAPTFFTLGAVAVRAGRSIALPVRGASKLDDRALSVPGDAADRNLVRPVEPTYPRDAKNAGLQGSVKLKVRIGTDGRVMDAAVITGKPVFVPAAIDAVKQRVYRPTLLNGRPIVVDSQVDVSFRLDVIPASGLAQ